MDYQEWLLNQYVLKISAMTYSESWKKWLGIITAGTLAVSFSNVVYEFISTKGLDVMIPEIEAKYEEYAESTIEPYVVTVSGWFDNVSTSLGDLVDTAWAMTDYAIVDVIFAYLDGSLTSDTDYA